jgi:hypothetical protein
MNKQDYKKLMYTGTLGAIDRNFYGTPSMWIAKSHEVMGSIELDPASCVEANATIGAYRFFAEEDNALVQDWTAETVFLNPPYSDKAKQEFAHKFRNEWEAGHIKQAIILINNCTETRAFENFSFCASARAEPRKRIQFINVEGRCDKNGNTRGQVFFYCGRRFKRFARVFKAAGCRVLQEIK